MIISAQPRQKRTKSMAEIMIAMLIKHCLAGLKPADPHRCILAKAQNVIGDKGPRPGSAVEDDLPKGARAERAW